ncbi:MAG TPA: prolipoprotein diacylglyceryl transferase family protein [Pirellulales bacterium]|nr:prolipoprotein diacylglyceryl transferase family protein [Pirellulales bacterium]
MWQTLFHFPINWLLTLWAIGSVVSIAWAAREQGLRGALRSYLPTVLIVGAIVGLLLPRLSEHGALPIRGYGFMLLIGLVSGVGLAMHRARRMGINPEMIHVLAFWMVLAGIVGARSFYVIEYWHQYHQPTLLATLKEIVNFTKGGLVVFGSAVGAGLALLLFVRTYHLPGLALADLISPSVMLGLACGRVGCFLNGCCFGGVCDEPWAVRFPPGSPAYQAQAKEGQFTVFGLRLVPDEEERPIIKSVERGSPAERAGLLPGQRLKRVGVNELEWPTPTVDEALFALQQARTVGDRVHVYVVDEPLPASWTLATSPGLTLPIHPAQIYAAVDALLLCLLLLAYYPYRRRDGEVFALMITIHPISRFLQEWTRVDEASIFGTGLTISQNVSIFMLLGAIGLWCYLLRRPRGSVWPRPLAAA